MALVPADTPVAIPDIEPIVATPVADELHVPPAVLLLRLVVVPEQMLSVPLIADGSALTVTVLIALQPVASA